MNRTHFGPSFCFDIWYPIISDHVWIYSDMWYIIFMYRYLCVYIYIYPHILGPLPVQEITHVLKPFQEPMQRVAFQMRRVAWRLNFCPFSVERWHRKTPTLQRFNSKSPWKVSKIPIAFFRDQPLNFAGWKNDSGRGWTVALLSEGCGFFQNLENCQAVKRNASVGSLVRKDGLESTVGFTAMHFFVEPELMRLTNEGGFSLC